MTCVADDELPAPILVLLGDNSVRNKTIPAMSRSE